jgi:hypothetical protein
VRESRGESGLSQKAEVAQIAVEVFATRFEKKSVVESML